jgi:hypothetical protein
LYLKAIQRLAERMRTRDKKKENGSPSKSKKAKKRRIPRKDLDEEHLLAIIRQLQIASSSIDVYFLDQLLDEHDFGAHAENIAQMRLSHVDFMKLAKCMFVADGERTPNRIREYLWKALRGSPVLRFILQDLKDNILNRKPGEKIKKLLITEEIPILAYYYELVLQFIGINARTFHSELTDTERQEMIEEFNDDDSESIQVLIQMYSVGFAGTNLQKNCSRVIIASQASSFAVQSQATHRIIRVGQPKDVTVILCQVNNTYAAHLGSR